MPVRTSKRSKAQAEALSAIDVQDVDFGHLWRQLVRVGWTSKRPTRLSNLHSYYPPNAAKELHIEGVNMFVGKSDVGIIGADEGGAGDDRDDESEEGEPEVPAESMSGDEPDVALSLCAGQNGAVVEPVTPTNSRRNDERTNSREDRGLLQEDVNIMKDEDNADEYESMDSESDGFGSDDDSDIVQRQIGDDVSSDEEEAPLMDAAFIDCLGGSLSIEDMNQITLRSMAWTPASSERAKSVHVSFVKDAAYQVKRYGMFAVAYESNLITYRARFFVSWVYL
ncbi:hypothetical protein PInf_011510 [Phytophthora infestans]|nr:hypothetical protein PInf_011510 [Phytophthora infestans]